MPLDQLVSEIKEAQAKIATICETEKHRPLATWEIGKISESKAAIDVRKAEISAYFLLIK